MSHMLMTDLQLSLRCWHCLQGSAIYVDCDLLSATLLHVPTGQVHACTLQRFQRRMEAEDDEQAAQQQSGRAPLQCQASDASDEDFDEEAEDSASSDDEHDDTYDEAHTPQQVARKGRQTVRKGKAKHQVCGS